MSTFVIIEDERPIRMFLSINLVSRGHTVLEAASAEEGLTLLGSTHPRAVLLDIVLPRMTGWELLDQMAADAALQHIPVVVFTASTIGLQDIAANYPNVVECLVKPISVVQLLNTIERLSE